MPLNVGNIMGEILSMLLGCAIRMSRGKAVHTLSKYLVEVEAAWRRLAWLRVGFRTCTYLESTEQVGT